MQPFHLKAPSQAVRAPRPLFVGGPVDGAHLVVLPLPPDQVAGRITDLPTFAVVRHKPEQDNWAVGDLDPQTGQPWPQAVYRLDLEPTIYQYVRAVTDRYPRVTCPRCGLTSYHPQDVANGYCGACHAETRIPRFAVVRPPLGRELPAGLDGRWLLRTGTGHLTAAALRLGAAELAPTGEYEQNIAGLFAQVHHLVPG